MIGRLDKYVERIRTNPRYMFMRGIARFSLIRSVAKSSVARRPGRSLAHVRAEQKKPSLLFGHLDVDDIVNRLRRDGYAPGIDIPARYCERIMEFARSELCYAERNPSLGFVADRLGCAEAVLGRTILLGQVFNSSQGCESIREIESDPRLHDIAAQYLGARPLHVGTLLWWSFPSAADSAARSRAAQMFHYDLDDYAFLKFFFYITEVDEGGGPHVLVAGSHIRKRHRRFIDRFLVRRYTDSEVAELYGLDRVVSIKGPSGSGFAEDTLCIHKGQPPSTKKRLLLQVQFALNDYENQNDRMDPGSLTRIPISAKPRR